MNSNDYFAQQTRRGVNRSRMDQFVATFISGTIMLGTIIVSIVVAFKTSSLLWGGLCFVSGMSAIVGFGKAFWQKRL